MKKLVTVLLGIIVLVVGAAAVFVLTFNADQYKPRIEALASEQLGTRVAINGLLSLALANWRPAVDAHDVVIGDAKKGDTVVTISSLEIGLPALSQIRRDPPWTVYVEADGVNIDGEEYGSYESHVTIDADGAIDAPDIKGRYGGGKVTGKLSYGKNRLKADINIKDLDYAAITDDLKGDNVSVAFNGAAHGKDGKQMIATLGGRLTVLGGEGEMAGSGVGFWGGELLTAFLSSGAKSTKINCFVADFDIRNGVLTSRKALLDTEPVAIIGEGYVNLNDENVNMKFTPQPKRRAILNVNTAMRARGTFGNIKVEPDAMGVAKTVGKLLLGAANPLTAVVPFVFQDTADKSACEQYLQAGKDQTGNAAANEAKTETK